ncbi:hypothetical protein [Cupriavidus sp. 8B]
MAEVTASARTFPACDWGRREIEIGLPAHQDVQARGLPRTEVDDLLVCTEARVVLTSRGEPRGFAMLRRFSRGHGIDAVVTLGVDGAAAGRVPDRP